MLADPDLGAILPPDRELKVRVLVRPGRLFVERHGARHPIGSHQLEVLHRQQLGFGVTENARRYGIDEGEPPVRIGAVNHVAGVVDEVAVAPLGACDGLRADAHLLVQRPVPGGAADKEQHDHSAANPQHGRIALEPRAPDWIAEALFHDTIELTAGLEAIQRDPQRCHHQVATGQDGHLIRPRQQRHLRRIVGQRVHEEAQCQVIPGHAIHLASLERANRIAASGDYLQRGSSRLGQGGEQPVVDRPVIDGHPHAPQVVEPARITRQAGAHHDDLRQCPGLVEQLILGGAVVGVRQEHHVGLAGVELRHALVARAQANLHRQAGFAREGTHQLDVEALRRAVVVEILVGRKLAIPAVDDGLGGHLRATRYGGQVGGHAASRGLRRGRSAKDRERADGEHDPGRAEVHGRL